MTQNMFENPNLVQTPIFFNSLMLETDNKYAYPVPISLRQDMSLGTPYLHSAM